MESDFQNLVSDFDFNLYEETTNIQKARPVPPICPVARKLGVYRMKHRMKCVSQVVHKATRTTELLLEVHKELLDTRQDLRETRKLLFDKNEEHKVICDERSKYFDQATEYSNEIQNLKEQLKKFEDQDFDTQLKDKIINGYSEQMKGLQTEMDNLMDEKKQKNKNASLALRNAKASKTSLEKKLIRLLKDYVIPTIKKRDRWLESIIKRHLLKEEVEEESNKLEKIDDTGEKQDDISLDEKELSTPPIQNRNASVDFDYIGSVDTGRGSSLASESGKSVDSPDYSISSSPPCIVGNICNKCNIPKSDVSTSTISLERSDNAENLATNIWNRCVLLPKKDACTSPIPSQTHDAATNTSDDDCTRTILSQSHHAATNTSEVSIQIMTPRKDVTFNSEESNSKIDQTHMSIGKISQVTHIPAKQESISGYNEFSSTHTEVTNKESLVIDCHLRKLEDFTFDTDDEDNVSNGSGFASPVALDASSPVHFDEVVTNSQNILSEAVPTAELNTQDHIGPDGDDSDENSGNISRNQSHVGESPNMSQSGIETATIIQSEKEALSMLVKLQDNTASDNDDEVMHNVSSIKESHMFLPVDFENNASNCTLIASTTPPTTPTKLQNKSTKININRKAQERECLELNNSNNFSNDLEYESEIGTILDKMRLPQIITPIPATPPQGIIQSSGLPVTGVYPVENRNSIGSQAQLIAETINDQINLLRTKIQEAFAPFVETIPHYLGQIPRLFSHDDLNGDLLNNLLCDPNENKIKNKSKFPPYNAQAESNKRRQPDVVDLNMGSMLCITETRENEKDSTCNDYNIMEEDSEVEDQMTSIESDTQHNGIWRLINEHSHAVKNNKMSDAALMKAEKSDFAASMNVKITADNSFNKSNSVQITHENTHMLFNGGIADNRNMQVSVVNSNPATTSSIIESRKSIVYEGGDISDDDSDMQISELDNSTDNHNENPEEVLHKKKGKVKKLSKLESMRLKMLPKSKIKNDNTRSVKKLRPKPIPIKTVTKKKVMEYDTAASLNDKSVYEKAVKVVAALRLAKEPKIIVKDCVLYSLEKSKTDVKNNDENKDDHMSESQSPTEKNTVKNKKRKLTENISKISENHSFDLNKGERTSEGTPLDKIISNKSPKKIQQKLNNIASQKLSCDISDAKTPSAKRTREVVHTSGSKSETKEPKRKKTSVSDCRTPNRNSKYNDKIIEQDSPRMLRSSSHLKHSIETGSQPKQRKPDETPNVAQLHKRLRSKVDQNKPDTDDSTSILSLGRKPRTSMQNPRRGSESTQVELNTSPVSEISRKNNNRADLNSFSNEDITSDEDTVDQNILKTDDSTSILRLGRKPVTAREKAHEGPGSTQAELHSSTVSEISREDKHRVVSYAELDLFSDVDNEDQMVNQNNQEADDNTSILPLGRKPRIARQKTDLGSESTQVDPHTSTLPVISKKKSDSAVTYADLSLFSNEVGQDQRKTADRYRKDSLLCRLIEKYGVQRIKFFSKQAPESKVNEVCQKLETSLSTIIEVPHNECLSAMKRLAAEIRTWNVKHFLLGFIKFLKNPERKIELFSKSNCPPSPPMTKKEQVLLYILDELQKSCDYRNIVQKILMNIEYSLFALNKAGESYDVVEVMSHFYALLCRSYQKISQLRLFIVDAMYCLQLKSVILVQQCLEVWMFVLPLGHMGLAKCPLVTCLVYLLHFYKCKDKHTRVQDVRNMLRWKYNYDMTDWNEKMILDLFRTAIIELRDSPLERKTLRLSLLILSKRNGAKWAHNNIVKNMLQPLISDSSTSDRVKHFCVSLLGPILKPYPGNMKVHYEIVIDYLMSMLHRENSPKMQEAIISSLIYVDKNNNRLHEFLATWSPKQVSSEFQLMFRDYVRSKTVHTWKQILSWQIY